MLPWATARAAPSMGRPQPRASISITEFEWLLLRSADDRSGLLPYLAFDTECWERQIAYAWENSVMEEGGWCPLWCPIHRHLRNPELPTLTNSVLRVGGSIPPC